MGRNHYHFRCNMVTQMIRPRDRWASLVYPHHCHQPRGTSGGNRTLSAADNRQCQETCQIRWVAYPSSRHRQRTFFANGILRSGRAREGRQMDDTNNLIKHARDVSLFGGSEIRAPSEVMNIAQDYSEHIKIISV